MARRDAIAITTVYGLAVLVVCLMVQEPLPTAMAVVAFLVLGATLLYGVFHQKHIFLLPYLFGQILLFILSVIVVILAVIGLIIEANQLWPMPSEEDIKKMSDADNLRKLTLYYRRAFTGTIGVFVIALLTVLQWKAYKAMLTFFNDIKSAGPNKSPGPPA